MLVLSIWHWAKLYKQYLSIWFIICYWVHSKNAYQEMSNALLLNLQWQVGLIANVKLHFFFCKLNIFHFSSASRSHFPTLTSLWTLGQKSSVPSYMYMFWQKSLTFKAKISLTFPDFGTIMHMQIKQFDVNASQFTSILSHYKSVHSMKRNNKTSNWT